MIELPCQNIKKYIYDFAFYSTSIYDYEILCDFLKLLFYDAYLDNRWCRELGATTGFFGWWQMEGGKLLLFESSSDLKDLKRKWFWKVLMWKKIAKPIWSWVIDLVLVSTAEQLCVYKTNVSSSHPSLQALFPKQQCLRM